MRTAQQHQLRWGSRRPNWYRSRDSILAACSWAWHAKKHLSDIDYQALRERFPRDPTYLCKLTEVGGDPRLYKPEVRKLLPPAFTTINEIHQMNDEEFNRALERGELHEDVRRKDVQNLRVARSYKRARLPDEVVGPPPKRRSPTPNFTVFGQIILPLSFPSNQQDELALFQFQVDA